MRWRTSPSACRAAEPTRWSASQDVARRRPCASPSVWRRPTRGSVVLDGTEIGGLSWTKLRPLRRKAQLVHQDPFATLDPKFTIAQSITEPLVVVQGRRPSEPARSSRGSCSTRSPCRSPTGSAPGRTLRRAAPAGGHRPGAGPQPRSADARRAGLRARRVRAGTDPALLADLQTQARPVLPVRLARPGRRRRDLAHGLGDEARAGSIEQGPVAEVFTNPQDQYTRELIDGDSRADPPPQLKTAGERTMTTLASRESRGVRSCGAGQAAGIQHPGVVPDR